MKVQLNVQICWFGCGIWCCTQLCFLSVHVSVKLYLTTKSTYKTVPNRTKCNAVTTCRLVLKAWHIVFLGIQHSKKVHHRTCILCICRKHEIHGVWFLFKSISRKMNATKYFKSDQSCLFTYLWNFGCECKFSCI